MVGEDSAIRKPVGVKGRLAVWPFYVEANPVLAESPRSRSAQILGVAGRQVKRLRHRGRRAVGTRFSQAKLTDDQVRTILADGRSARAIAKDYTVDRRLIWAIKTGRDGRTLRERGQLIDTDAPL